MPVPRRRTACGPLAGCRRARSRPRQVSGWPERITPRTGCPGAPSTPKESLEDCSCHPMGLRWQRVLPSCHREPVCLPGFVGHLPVAFPRGFRAMRAHCSSVLRPHTLCLSPSLGQGSSARQHFGMSSGHLAEATGAALFVSGYPFRSGFCENCEFSKNFQSPGQTSRPDGPPWRA